jgi:hypothetical protein
MLATLTEPHGPRAAKAAVPGAAVPAPQSIDPTAQAAAEGAAQRFQYDFSRVHVRPPLIGAADAPEEREAEAAADAALRGDPPVPLRRTAAVIRRSPDPTPGWHGTKGINAAPTTVGTIRRVPIDGLPVGLQTAKTPSGKALVLIPAAFDPTLPADVLLHFHGHDGGFAESGGKVRDEQQDRIEAQLEAAGRGQLLAILPQGDVNSSFGTQDGQKVFDTDAFIAAVLTMLDTIKALTPQPKIARVTISGHSGAGELINEKLLGGAPGSALPAAPRALAEVALFDGVNGPHEFEALQDFLKRKLADESAALAALPDTTAQRKYLQTSFRFRAYFSHARKAGKSEKFYAQWHVGPLRAGQNFKDPRPIKRVLDDFFDALTALDPGVVKAFRDNYAVIDAGDKVDHDEMVGNSDHLLDALRVLPKHDTSAGPLPQTAPAAVHATLQRPGRELASADRQWAESRFRRSFATVHIHDDTDAARSAQAVRAHAYTIGRDIVFAPGRYVPGAAASRGLLAHELSHVVQQGALHAAVRPPAPGRLAVGAPDDRWEAEADGAAHTGRVDLSATAGLRLQREPDSKTLKAAVCEENANPHPAAEGECSAKEPGHCPTYEAWIATFARLNKFSASDTPGQAPTRSHVLGDGAADTDFRPPGTPPRPPPPPKTPLKPGERFIDHPTDTWVKACLPQNLRATAYQLPADCADVAMILRHVWLAAHGRTEKFGKWTLGSLAGRAEEKETAAMISSEGSASVAGMLAPYSDASGKRLRSFAALSPLLHPGDILVWAHFDNGFDKPRTGGHTHTIAAVDREPSGKITSLTLLQGNEPLFEPQKSDIHAFLSAEKPKAAQPTDKELGSAPGRRIERETSQQSGLVLSDTTDVEAKDGSTPTRVWKWGRETLLVAAGPPSAGGARPAVQRRKGEKGAVPRRLTDWIPAFAAAPLERVINAFEGMLYELRAAVEGGSTLVETDVRAVGNAAGADLWTRAKAAGKLGNTTHFAPLQNVLDMIDGFAASRGGPKSRQLDAAYDVMTESLIQHLRWLRDAFETAARGVADIDFSRGKASASAVNVLLTGFDPFEPSGNLQRPDPSQWNPSGAIVMALDNARLPVADSRGRKGSAAVEGVVLPVSFEAFNAGIVERAVGPHVKELDAVLTVSMDGQRKPGEAVRLERYAVGVHEIGGSMQGVPAAGGGTPGPVVIETNAPLDAIADATARPAGRNPKAQPAIERPQIGESFVFDFGSPVKARAAQTTLGGVRGGTAGTDVEANPLSQLLVNDSATVGAVTASMTRAGTGAQVRFRFKQTDFNATLIDGPGGNFLSNEVSYRSLRLLKDAAAPKDPLSFHVHTPSAEPAAAARASAATAQRGELIETVKRLIGVVSKIILDKRTAVP